MAAQEGRLTPLYPPAKAGGEKKSIMRPENHPSKLVPAKGYTQLHVEILGMIKRHGCDCFVQAAPVKWLADELTFYSLMPGRRNSGPLKSALLKLEKYGYICFTDVRQIDCYLTNKRLLSGICRQCGCTELCACEEGCGWTDETKTRCTQCQSRKLET